jgi:hypothetical protein
MVAFGGVPLGGICSSERIHAQPNAEATQLEKAQKIAQQRDQAMAKGTDLISKFSIASIPNEVVIARASKLGISLGDSPTQVSSSIKSIKEVDLQRTLVMLQRNEEKVKKGESTISNLVLEKAIELSADLEEEEQQGSEGHKDLTLPVPKQKCAYKRKTTEVSVARRTNTRLKLKKGLQ